jgi:hypothetical protein
MSIRIHAIHRYPVKGLSAQEMDAVDLTPGLGLPHDRRFAILHGATGFDPTAPSWKPKSNFLMLMRDEKLATLETSFDADTCQLTISRGGKPVARGRIDTPTGRMLIDQFLGAYMAGSAAPGPYKITEAPGHMFSDIQEKAVSLINLASVKDIERVANAPVDPRRFRGNLLLEGLEPWAENGWVGKRLTVGGVELEIFKTITRCAATEVNPVTADRDINMLKVLRTGFGHVLCGVYARVLTAGRVARGDGVAVGA